MKMIMKKMKYIFEIITLIIIILAFFSLIFNWSWRYYPIGYVIGYALAVVIERLTSPMIKGFVKDMNKLEEKRMEEETYYAFR
jgi:lipoprotein signal peptidase